MNQHTTKVDRVHIVVAGVAMFVFMLVVGVFVFSVEKAEASGFVSCVQTSCDDYLNSLSKSNALGQCIAEQCRSSISGADLDSGTANTSDPHLETPLIGDACVNECGTILLIVSSRENKLIDDISYLTTCVDGCYGAASITGDSSPTLASLFERIQEQSYIQQAQREGLCVLKNKLNKREVESILSRDIVETEITNVNVGDIVGEDEDARNILCTYSSIKLVMRYLFFIAGVATLTMILIAGFLWIKSQGETDKRDTAKKVLLTAVGGAVIVLLIQVILRIIPSLL